MINRYIKLKDPRDKLKQDNIKRKQNNIKLMKDIIKLKRDICVLNNDYIKLQENSIEINNQYMIYKLQYTVLYCDYIFMSNFIKQLCSYSSNLLIYNINNNNMLQEMTDKKNKFLDKLLECTNKITNLETSLTYTYKLLSYFMYT